MALPRRQAVCGDELGRPPEEVLCRAPEIGVELGLLGPHLVTIRQEGTGLKAVDVITYYMLFPTK